MSGHKRAFVRLSRLEYERLRDAASDNRLSSSVVTEPTPAQTAAVISQSSSAIWDDLESVQERQNALEDLLGRFDHQVRSLEHHTGAALIAQQQSLAEEMQQNAGRLYQDADRLIQQHLRSFREQVSREVREARSAYQISEQRWQQLDQDHSLRRETAQRWLRAAQEIAVFINSRYPHELVAPGSLAQTEQGLGLAEQNLASHLDEAALAAAQQGYLKLSELRLDLERLEGQRLILSRAIEQKLREMRTRAQAARAIPAVDLDGIELGVQLDVDFWTGGGLSQLQGDQQALLEMLSSPLDIPALEGLRDALPGMETHLGELIEEARLAVINSQLRFDIAEVVVSALSEQGFALEEGAYAAGDAREGYCVRLRSAEGSEVEVHIAPRPGGALENDVHLLSHDAEARTRHELRARMNELARSLAWHGLEVSQPEQVASGKPLAGSTHKKRQTIRLEG